MAQSSQIAERSVLRSPLFLTLASAVAIGSAAAPAHADAAATFSASKATSEMLADIKRYDKLKTMPTAVKPAKIYGSVAVIYFHETPANMTFAIFKRSGNHWEHECSSEGALNRLMAAAACDITKTQAEHLLPPD